MAELPKAFRRFRRANPAVVKAHEALGETCAKAGPLDPKTRELVKLGMAIGGRLEGAVHSHARRARAPGAGGDEIRHVVALAAPTIGFPTTVAAFSWVEEILSRSKRPPRR